MTPLARRGLLLTGLLGVTVAALLAAPATAYADPTGPTGPSGPTGDSNVTIGLDGLTDSPSTSVTVLIGLTLISLLPAILLSCTAFTKIFVVLGLTRNALGLQQTPPNQVLAGLALFLSLFVMGPVLSQINSEALQPYQDGEMSSSQAIDAGLGPLRDFMLDNTDDDEIELLTNVADRETPKTRDDVPTTTLIPAFVLTELKQAFIIGFIIFIPFLVIDLVVSGALMALGMMMMPPVMVSLPFKLLLFVMVDGWALVIKSLVASYG
ncbi:flagellar type III secretion system pore protein FliP [Nocardioides mangrovi]|uniref:Flagellar biosynthetic protein FliP n=1 Tax=Nocardioides mangrovi TaxID=2874580 RepID=A0ABS7UAS7_9ACTN|nr:flagellar type III secretion system pore protein FliP [Nocardioides mangrovi]MBZ5737826.1 flagellar type III secretion system pore protein FliP [Nocardioides mangrovi]